MATAVRTDLGLNGRARDIVDRVLRDADALRVAVTTLSGGARVVDAGVQATGGLGAGLAVSEICMGGLGHIAYGPVQIGAEVWPGLTVWTDHPAIACMASQYAGWSISVDKFFAMGSGPLRAHARVERELFEKLGYEEEASHGVLVLEGRTLPDRRGGRMGRAEGAPGPQSAHVGRRPDGQPRGRRPDLGAHPRNRPAQDGDAGLRRPPGGQRHRHRADAAGREERPAGDRPDQRLHPVRGPGAVYRAWPTDAELAELVRQAARVGVARLRHAVLRHLPALRAATSIRSTRCCSAPPKCGSPASRAGERSTRDT